MVTTEASGEIPGSSDAVFSCIPGLDIPGLSDLVRPILYYCENIKQSALPPGNSTPAQLASALGSMGEGGGKECSEHLNSTPTSAACLSSGSLWARAPRLVFRRLSVRRQHSATQRWSRSPPPLVRPIDPTTRHCFAGEGSRPAIPLEPGDAAVTLPVAGPHTRAPRQPNPQPGGAQLTARRR
ncbi:hypothetical protein NDU88_004103 [Pleurodeles waltl]|uniref:Uncharacterized protein n=1 Tax=Pleurodeles waltl TaxID=8319 RepID=A0AAV7RH52_PLEWA|nr:hypothetical protein NDU88_004103 [Pleurodeles waltl]